MSVSSVTNTLTPSQILQLLQPSVGSADSNSTAPTTEQDGAATGQSLPTGTESSADGATTTGASQASLDPKTVLALLKIQESQMMQADDPLLFDGTNGSMSTGDPLLDAMNGFGNGSGTSTQTDPLQALIDQLTAPTSPASSPASNAAAGAASSTHLSQIDPAQVLNTVTAMSGSAAGTNTLAATNQSLLDLLNQTSPTVASAAVSAASAAE